MSVVKDCARGVQRANMVTRKELINTFASIDFSEKCCSQRAEIPIEYATPTQGISNLRFWSY
jgi:hypothetical protein